MKTGIVYDLFRVVLPGFVSQDSVFATIKLDSGGVEELKLFSGASDAEYRMLRLSWLKMLVYQKTDGGEWVRGIPKPAKRDLEAEALGRKFKTISSDVSSSPEHCVFCFKHANTLAVSQSHTCSYGARHEFPEQPLKVVESIGKPSKVDTQICIACRVHKRNPVSKTNGCEHIYPEATMQ
jgi:hypothetical protein